jgi:hypothetical protein
MAFVTLYSASWIRGAFLLLVPFLRDDELVAHLPAVLAKLPKAAGDQVIYALVDDLLAARNQAILALVPVVNDEHLQAFMLSRCAPHLSGSTLEEAIASARIIGDGKWRAHALRALAENSTLASEHRQTLLEEASAAAPVFAKPANPSVPASGAPARATVRSRSLEELEERLRSTDDESERAEILTEMIARAIDSDDSILAKTVGAMCSLEAGAARDASLASLALRITEAGRLRALAALFDHARTSGATLCDARVLAFAARLLPHDERSEAIGRALATVRPHGFDWETEVAKRRGERPPGHLDRVWDKRPSLAHVLADVIALLPPEGRGAPVGEAVGAAYAVPMSWPAERAAALASVAELFPDQERLPLVAAAIAATKNIGDDYDKMRALIGLAPLVSPDLGGQAIDAANTIDMLPLRAKALDKLAPHVHPQDLTPALRTCLAAARTIGDDRLRDRALSALRAFSPQGDWSGPLEAPDRHVSETPADGDLEPASPDHGGERVDDIVSRLAESVLADVEAGRLENPDGDGQWVGVLVGFLAELSDSARQKAVTAVLAVSPKFEHDADRREAMTKIAPPRFITSQARPRFATPPEPSSM